MKRFIIENLNFDTIAEFETDKERWQWTLENCEKRFVAGWNDWGWFTKDTNEHIFYLDK